MANVRAFVLLKNAVFRGKIESLSVDLERLRKQLKAKEDVECRQIDAIRQLTVATQRLEEDLKNTKAENAELEGKLSALKEALDTAYKWDEISRYLGMSEYDLARIADFALMIEIFIHYILFVFTRF